MHMCATQIGQCRSAHKRLLSEKNDTTVVTNKAAALMAPCPKRWARMV